MTAPSVSTFVLLTSALIASGVAQAQQPERNSKHASVVTSKASVSSRPDQSVVDTKATAAEPVKAISAQKPPPPSPMFVQYAENVGFRPENVGGKVMFCRTATETGSRLPVKTCYDQEEMRLKLESHEFQRNQLDELRNLGAATIGGN